MLITKQDRLMYVENKFKSISSCFGARVSMKYTEGPHKWAMQREDRRIENPEDVREILRTAKIGHLGLVVDGKPYVVPVNFVFEKEEILIHSALEGKKIDFMKRNPIVSFNAYLAEDGGFPLDSTTGKRIVKWKSVICTCKATFVEDEEERQEALTAHLRKYELERKPELRCKRKVAIIKLEIVEMTGKQRPP